MKDQTEQRISAISITSKHFIQRIEEDIIKLVKCLSIEHQVVPDPDAKLIARKIIQGKINELITEEEIDGIRSLKKAIKENIHKSGEIGYLSGACYELLKLTGLDNV